MFNIFRIITISLLVSIMVPTLSAYANVQELVKECSGCHGQNGNSKKNDVPSIASFSVEFMQDVMHEFKANKRQGKRIKANAASPAKTMNEVAKKANPNDLKAALQHFSKQRFIPIRQPSNPALATKGKKIYDKRCMKCHGDNGNDPEEDAAILKGQWQPYIRTQMKELQAGKRQSPKKMKKQLKKLSPQDVEALMHYFAQP